ncbi:MAG: type II secretion system protein [Patescibacteria group bacterium]
MKSGYTLIELLVVISIMAILGVAVYTSSKSSSQNQAVKKAQGELQSYLRLAQSNATSSLKCKNSILPTKWYLQFSDDRQNIRLKCDADTNDQKILPLDPNVEIESIYYDSSSCPSSFTSSTINPVQVYFTALYGQVSFNDALNSCIGAGLTLTVKLRHRVSTTIIKTVTISKGGNIDAP